MALFTNWQTPNRPTMTLVGCLALATGCGVLFERVGELQHQNVHIALDKSEVVRTRLKMGTGELNLDTGTAQLMEGDFAYNTTSAKPEVDYRGGELSITQNNAGRNITNGGIRWNVKLNEQVALDLQIDLGVGEAHMNLAKANLRNLEVRMGVGEVQLDLRSTPKRSYDVRIHGGVGEATVQLPKNVGVVATAKGGIGDIHVTGLEKKGQYWVNPGHENDAVTIRVDVTGGVGEITLQAE